MKLSIDAEGLTFKVSAQATKTVRWADLLEVYIQTTDKGPVLEDVFFVLVTAEGEWKVPQGMAGTDLLLRQLQQLPGFDNEAVIRAMACADNAVFPCWKRWTGRH